MAEEIKSAGEVTNIAHNAFYAYPISVEDDIWGKGVLKEVAAHKGIILNTHRNIRDYTQLLSKGLGERSIYDAYGEASYLHNNFYQVELHIEEVYLYTYIRVAIAKLLDLFP